MMNRFYMMYSHFEYIYILCEYWVKSALVSFFRAKQTTGYKKPSKSSKLLEGWV
jgi:hypothetical protein